MVRRHAAGTPLAALRPVLSVAEVLELQQQALAVHVSAPILAYIVALVRATREGDAVRLGASPRAALALHQASQALALLHGRSYVLPDDVKTLAEPVLAHRLILSGNARLRGITPPDLIREVLTQVPVPAEPLAQDA